MRSYSLNNLLAKFFVILISKIFSEAIMIDFAIIPFLFLPTSLFPLTNISALSNLIFSKHFHVSMTKNTKNKSSHLPIKSKSAYFSLCWVSYTKAPQFYILKSNSIVLSKKEKKKRLFSHLFFIDVIIGVFFFHSTKSYHQILKYKSLIMIFKIYKRLCCIFFFLPKCLRKLFPFSLACTINTKTLTQV